MEIYAVFFADHVFDGGPDVHSGSIWDVEASVDAPTGIWLIYAVSMRAISAAVSEIPQTLSAEKED